MIKIARASSVMLPLMEIIGGVTIALSVIHPSQQTIQGSRSPGEFWAFITAFLLAHQPGEKISKKVVALQRRLYRAEAMFRILDEPKASHEGELEVLTGASSQLEFQHVSFGYGNDSPLLTDISFKTKPGERVAVVGPSGVEKTTLIGLLQGLSPRIRGDSDQRQEHLFHRKRTA